MTKFEYSSSMYRDGHEINKEKFLNKYGEDKEELYNHIKEFDYIVWRVYYIIDKIVEEDKTMSRVKDWLIEMEEDATHLSLTDWVAIHGISHKEIWEKINSGFNPNLDQLDLGL